MGVSLNQEASISQHRMDKELQAEFDYVLLGSNFENSVLAGSFRDQVLIV